MNFAVTNETVLDPCVLDDLFDKDKFIVKITPIHQTSSALLSGFDVGDSYQKCRKAPAFRHGDTRHTLFPRQFGYHLAVYSK